MKEFCQLDSQGFYIGKTVNYDWAGAIDTKEPIFDEKTEKAKWDSVNSIWIIKTITQWEQEEKEQLEFQKVEYEKQNKKQEILNKLNEIDLQSIRPNRNINIGIGTEIDRNKLIELEEKAKQLRLELLLI